MLILYISNGAFLLLKFVCSSIPFRLVYISLGKYMYIAYRNNTGLCNGFGKMYSYGVSCEYIGRGSISVGNHRIICKI